MSWDAQTWYQHFYLHYDFLNCSLINYDSHCYWFITPTFAWGGSMLWIVKLMHPLVHYLQQNWCYRILSYIDYVLMTPSPPGTPSSAMVKMRGGKQLTRLFKKSELKRNSIKICLQGTWLPEHLKVLLDLHIMRVSITDKKVQRASG